MVCFSIAFGSSDFFCSTLVKWRKNGFLKYTVYFESQFPVWSYSYRMHWKTRSYSACSSYYAWVALHVSRMTREWHCKSFRTHGRLSTSDSYAGAKFGKDWWASLLGNKLTAAKHGKFWFLPSQSTWGSWAFDLSSLHCIYFLQQKQQLPDMEFGRRMATERDLEKTDTLRFCNVGMKSFDI